jgi:hypothetical protein
VCCPPRSLPSVKMPEINSWSITELGEIRGTVSKHPTLRNGDDIVTSPLAYPRLAMAQAIVETKSGSLYRLRVPDRVTAVPAKTAPQNRSPSQKIPSIKIPAFSIPGLVMNNNKEEDPASLAQSIVSNFMRNPSIKIATSPQQQPGQEDQTPLQYKLTGETIGDGKYLLAGLAMPSRNKRSYTMAAYLAGADQKPTGDALIVKLSSNEEAMQREYYNFQKLWPAIKRGSIVRCLDFYPQLDKTQTHRSQCGLVLERGSQDLKKFRHSMEGAMDEQTLKEALWSAARCMSSIHASKLVWTDLKLENFVAFVDNNPTSEKEFISFKGIDMESAIPVKGNPIDYTPESCPPEFAKAYEEGDPHSFVLEYSYDIWSFGMLALEMSTGLGRFDNLRHDQIMKRVSELETMDFVFDEVEDETLADLITQCLSVDPKLRATSQKILKHPYFRGVGRPSMFGGW